MHIYVHARTHIHIHLQLHLHKHKHKHKHICIHSYIHINTIYIYIHNIHNICKIERDELHSSRAASQSPDDHAPEWPPGQESPPAPGHWTRVLPEQSGGLTVEKTWKIYRKSHEKWIG